MWLVLNVNAQKQLPWTFITSGMALGFFNLGPGTHMSGQIGVPRILGGSKNLGDLPLKNCCCCCYEKEWLVNYLRKPICCLHLLDKRIITPFANIVTRALKCCCWSNTFAALLWSTWFMWRTSAYRWKFLHPLVNVFFFPAFVQFLQIINKSSPEHLVFSHPNSFSHLSKNWLCLPPLSRFMAIIQVSGCLALEIYD